MWMTYHAFEALICVADAWLSHLDSYDEKCTGTLMKFLSSLLGGRKHLMLVAFEVEI